MTRPAILAIRSAPPTAAGGTAVNSMVGCTGLSRDPHPTARAVSVANTNGDQPVRSMQPHSDLARRSGGAILWYWVVAGADLGATLYRYPFRVITSYNASGTAPSPVLGMRPRIPPAMLSQPSRRRAGRKRHEH